MPSTRPQPRHSRRADRVPLTRLDASKACTHATPADRMAAVFAATKTPYKHGMVVPPPPGGIADCPSVFRHGDAWYMVYVAFGARRSRGYETRLAMSADLVSWRPAGTILAPRAGRWDAANAAGYVALPDTRWGGSGRLGMHAGRYWLSYLGGADEGYEEGSLSIGMAHAREPTRAHGWSRLERPVLSPRDATARAWETGKLYKSNVIHDKTRLLGAPFVMFYNATASTVANDGAEHIGMAVSCDLVTWQRRGSAPVLSPPGDYPKRVVADPQVVKIDDLWVMFFWCRFAGDSGSAVFNTFACSPDLQHWTMWEGEPLVTASEPFDRLQAHKPWLVKSGGIVYHFYGANGDTGFGIGLATSSDLKGPRSARP